MPALRRLYIYVLSGVSLGVLLVGLNLLLAVALGAIGLGRGAFVGGSPNADREQLSIAAALTVVGLLVWGVHWSFAERSVRGHAPAAVEEQGSALRGLYLSVVMGVLLAFGSVAGLTLLQGLAAWLLGADAPSLDVAGSIATVVVAGAAWIYHAWVRVRDLQAPASGAAAWIPRVYLYGASIVALGLLASALGRLLETALAALVTSNQAVVRGSGLADLAATAVAAVIAWTAVWIGHWWYSSRLIRLPGWRGQSERDARLRIAYYAAVLAMAGIGLLWSATEALRTALVEVLGVADLLGPDLDPLAMRIGAPSLAAAVWLIVALVHRAWMRTEAVVRARPGDDETVDRLDAGTFALIGLGFCAVGVAWILGIALDVALGGSRTVGDAWRLDLSRYAALAVVGIGPWIWNLARLQQRATAYPVAEAASPIRRAGLLLVIGAAILAGIGSLALVLYRAFGALFGAGISGSVTELSTPLAILVVAIAIAAYHATLLRRDQLLRAEGDGEVEGPEPVREETTGWPLLLTGPDSTDLDGTLAMLRTHLPPGVQLDRADRGEPRG